MRILFIVMLFAICFSAGNAFSDECVEGDCVNGQGTMVYSSGQKFSGEFKDGMRHGKGVFLLPGGRKLVGVWEDNEIREGTYTESDGTTYTGQWQFRERNGQGTLTWPDGRKYVGDYIRGERSGSGTMTFPDGRKYIGEFKDGERTGQGTLIHPDGKKLVGEFKNGEFVGK